jgi:mono/diheme cytochrome c family protein
MSTMAEGRGIRRALVVAVLLALPAAQPVAQPARGATTERFGFGSEPGAQELRRFVSPLPDGRGLPPGSGSVEQGKALYAQQCASCHGANLEGGIGDRLVGGRGTLVQRPGQAPLKTVESYWPYATTLFDYVKRAMPLTAPGSLSDDEVYAVSAYVLSVAGIVPPDATLDARSLAAVRMPNRDGFVPDPRPERFGAAPARASGH